MANKTRRMGNEGILHKPKGNGPFRAGGPVMTEARRGMEERLARGTANMVKLAGITEKDRVIIITDQPNIELCEKIEAAAKEKGASVELLFVEEFGKRPLTGLPPEFAIEIEPLEPTVSFLATRDAMPGELPFRQALIGLLASKKEDGGFHVRHVHMPILTEEVAAGEAMTADYDEVVRLTHKVHEIVKEARLVSVQAPNGTNFSAEFDGSAKWVTSDGQILEPGTVHNLPDGEVFTAPATVNGTFVTNLLGDYFSNKYGVLGFPIRITVENGRAVHVACPDPKLEKEIREYLNKGKNTNRVGEFAIGTNTGVTKLIGNMLADEKAAGVHIAFGDPLGHYTAATWKADQHCDMVVQDTTIIVDGSNVIMRDGKFLI